MLLTLPELCLVLLVGPSGSGKSTLARRLFRPTEVISSDHCRALICDDEADQRVTPEAFELLHHMVDLRLRAGRLTVVDATNVSAEARRSLLELARRRYVAAAALVLDLPAALCEARDAARPHRTVGPAVIAQQFAQLRQSLRELDSEGIRPVAVLRTAEELDALHIVREPLPVNRRDLHGPFDLIGDIHGCHEELESLLQRLGYPARGPHPDGRRLVFLGDLVDRGPGVNHVLRRVMGLVREAGALCVCGNHEAKLAKALAGKTVTHTHGLAESIAQLNREPAAFREEVATFIEALPSHLFLDEGGLVAVHAGLKRGMQGRSTSRVRDFALYGDTRGETDEYGLPIRHNWAAEYTGEALVVYGHTPVPEPSMVNNAICIDTGCVFGGALTALRYPERVLVRQPALRQHYPPSRPMKPLVDEREPADRIELQPLLGRRHLLTAAGPILAISAEVAAAALHTLARSPLDPRGLIALPARPRPLADLAEALASPAWALLCPAPRAALALLCDSEATARRRFGLVEGRGLLTDALGQPLPGLALLLQAVDEAGLWARHPGGWLCLELAVRLDPVDAAAISALEDAAALLDQEVARWLGEPPARTAPPAPVTGLWPLRLLATEAGLALDADPRPLIAALAGLGAPRVYDLAEENDRSALTADFSALGETLRLFPKAGGPAGRLLGPQAQRRVFGPTGAPPLRDPAEAEALAAHSDRLLREGLRRATAGEPVARWLPYSLGLLGAATSPVEPALGPL